MAQNQPEQTGRSGEMTQGSQRSSGRAVARRGGEFPSMFALNPIEFLTMSPFALMRRFSQEFDRMLGEGGAGTSGQAPSWTPAIEVRQEGNDLQVTADLPGVKPENVQVEMTDEGLVIQGERRQEHEEKREGFHRTERSYGRFFRLIPLPETINVDQVRADFHDGVLEVHVPLPEQRETRRQIPIQGASRQQQQSGTAGAKESQTSGRSGSK